MNRPATACHKVLMGVTFHNTATPGRGWLKAAALASGLLLLAALVTLAPILSLAWLDPFGGPRHPTDDQLLVQFAKHRNELERGVTMTRQDSQLQRLAPDFIRPDSPVAAGLSQERIAS